MYPQRRDVDVNIAGIPISNTSSSGQITLYIILGIIIILALVLYLLFQFSITRIKPDTILPGQQGKVSTYISSCLEEVSRVGLMRIGEQAGYITVPQTIELDASRHLRTSPLTVAPYWAYGPIVAIPSLAQLEERLDVYLQDNLKDCVFDSSGLQKSFDLIEKGEIISSTKIHPKGITFTIDWTIEIRDKAGEVITEIDQHTYESPVKLHTIHEIAQSIIRAEMRQFKLEDLTQDLIALEHPRLPVSGIAYSCSKKKWKFNQAKETLQTLLRINLPQLQVVGTSLTPHPDSYPYYQNHYRWDIANITSSSSSSYRDISVRFYYDSTYPFTFDVSPRSGGTLHSENLIPKTKYMPLLCLQSWKFAYDVSYPVLVTLTDETTGYNLKVPFTVHLENNYASRRPSGKPNSPILLSTTDDDDYCASAKMSMLVRTVEVVDNPFTGVHTSEPLDNVNVTFICLKYECNIGQTTYNFGGLGAVSAIRANFPPCVGGYLRTESPLHISSDLRVVVSPNQEFTIQSIPIYPFSLDKIKVKSHTLIPRDPDSSASTDNSGSSDAFFAGPARDLADSEVALIKISFDRGNITFNPETLPDHESQVVYSGILDRDLQKSQNLNFLSRAEFTYFVDISVFDEEKLISAYQANWTVPWQDLQYASELTFHTIRLPSSLDAQFEFIQDLPQQSTVVPHPELR